MKSLHSYIPELSMLETKHRDGTRAVHEDCAVVDAASGYRILAGRGEQITPEATLPALCGLTKSDIALLETALCKHHRILLKGKRRTVLIFADMLQETGTLIAILPHAGATAFRRALTLTGHHDLVCIPSFPEPSATDTDEEVCEQVEELFFYMDRILLRHDGVGIWTRSLLIANFTGCKLENVALPVENPPISAADEARLTVFLFCVFLTLRQKNGQVSAKSVQPLQANEAYSYQVVLTPTDPPRQKRSAKEENTDFPFLSLPAFYDFSARISDGRAILEAILPQSSKLPQMFHSAQDAFLHLRLELWGA